MCDGDALFDNSGLHYPITFNMLKVQMFSIRPKKKKLCCPLPTDRKMRKNRVRIFFFFFFLMSDLGEEFAKICIQWLKKKALVYAF